ncbi:MAG: hypoxanthine-guanine phosphoribosyltransferase [Gammaproteobacteria bacterium]|nr:hypoxanthine-guanine phosphoribosyltransferase [Gammaproteobacteria bacterium]
MTSTDDIKKIQYEADCLYTANEVETALNLMAAEIDKTIGDNDPLVLCVLTGAIIPMGHLLTRLSFPLEIDYLHASRYRKQTSGGELGWYTEMDHSFEGRTLLIVDDILDEGETLKAIVEYCKQAGANSIYTAVLVEKMHDRKSGIKADFVGLETEDRYLFGYGMDYKGYLRNANGIYAVKGM